MRVWGLASIGVEILDAAIITRISTRTSIGGIRIVGIDYSVELELLRSIGVMSRRLGIR